MYELSIQTEFAAAHAIRIRGAVEPIHGHNWRVTAVVSGSALDADGLLVDFHALEASLHAIVKPFHNNNLDTTPPFDRLNSTAEHVARYIAQQLAARPPISTAPHLRVHSVSVTEAPGCAATFRPIDQHSPGHAEPSHRTGR